MHVIFAVVLLVFNTHGVVCGGLLVTSLSYVDVVLDINMLLSCGHKYGYNYDNS